jgi:hypothetical protein
MLKIIVNYQKINKFVIINKEQLQGSNQLLNLIKGLSVEPRGLATRDKRNFKVTFLNV